MPHIEFVTISAEVKDIGTVTGTFPLLSTVYKIVNNISPTPFTPSPLSVMEAILVISITGLTVESSVITSVVLEVLSEFVVVLPITSIIFLTLPEFRSD